MYLLSFDLFRAPSTVSLLGVRFFSVTVTQNLKLAFRNSISQLSRFLGSTCSFQQSLSWVECRQYEYQYVSHQVGQLVCVSLSPALMTQSINKGTVNGTSARDTFCIDINWNVFVNSTFSCTVFIHVQWIRNDDEAEPASVGPLLLLRCERVCVCLRALWNGGSVSSGSWWAEVSGLVQSLAPSCTRSCPTLILSCKKTACTCALDALYRNSRD